METLDKRLKRFLFSSEHEIPLSILNSIHNIFIPQLRVAVEKELDDLIFLGTHAIMQTVCEKIFGKRGLASTQFYLKHFVDGSSPDCVFSSIAAEIHQKRNIMAHQWFSIKGHKMALNYRMPEGWKRVAFETHINPRIYGEHFFAGYDLGGRIWKYDRLISARELVIRKYSFIKDWLHVDKKHQISLAIQKLEECSTPQEFRNQEDLIKSLICSQYNIQAGP